MEISVLGAEGTIADCGCVLSIRAGSSRRQGALQIEKPLHFPVKKQDAVPFKIDLLRHLGSAQVDNLEWDGMYDLPIEPVISSAVDDGVWLKLKVVTKSNLCGRSPADLKHWDAREGLKENNSFTIGAQSRQYFHNHNIMNVIQALLQALIHEKPDEPYGFLQKFMNRISPGKKAGMVENEGDRIISVNEAINGKVRQGLLETSAAEDEIKKLTEAQEVLILALENGTLKRALAALPCVSDKEGTTPTLELDALDPSNTYSMAGMHQGDSQVAGHIDSQILLARRSKLKELLDQQSSLEKQNQMYEQQIMQLKSKKAKGDGALLTQKRKQYRICQELYEANVSLRTENIRLRAELTRLLERIK